MNSAFDPRSLTLFLHDCFREDHRSQAVLDINSSKVERKHVFEHSAELLSQGRATAIKTTELEELSNRANLHQSEMVLSLGAIFVIGSVITDEKKTIVCAPLITYPLRLDPREHEPSELEWSIDRDRPRLSHALLAQLAVEQEVPQDQIDQILDRWSDDAFSSDSLKHLAGSLEALLPNLNASRLSQFPELTSKSALQALRAAARRRPSGSLVLAPAMVAMLIRRSLNTRGVLSELERLSGDELSTPLMALFDPLEPQEPILERPVTPISDELYNLDDLSVQKIEVNAPALLSSAQKQVVQNAASHALSLVIGPPGTGKSFTIASIALDALSRGESVLIASHTHHAVDVIGDKLEDLLGQNEFVVRGGRKSYQKELKQRVISWLSGRLPGKPTSEPRLRKTRERLRSLAIDIEDIESKLKERSRLEQDWGTHTVEGPTRDHLIARLKSRYHAWRLGRSIRELETQYWQDMNGYKQSLEKRLELQAELIRHAIRFRLFKVLTKQRRQLTRFRDAIRARTGQRRAALFESIDLDVLLHALPVWLVNLADAASILPLRRELFDLVILDESTQCDIAACLPVLQRAKRAVVVGDPKQLRHLSFLSRDRQERLGESYGLGHEALSRFDYRDKSILDVVDDTLQAQEQLVLLDEHFRSAPSIIAFSNREFYGNRLRIMQEHPAHDYHRALYLRRAEGSRTEDGSNPAEAEALLQELFERIDLESETPDLLAPSIGVLSPFRAQAELLSDRLSKHLPPTALKRHRLKVGTAYAFQGEERDIMFLSLALDSESHPSAFRYLERPDVFNVAITRARSEQIVYTSLLQDLSREAKDSLVYRFLKHMEVDVRPSANPGTLDPFINQVKSALAAQQYRVWAAYSVAGLEVDLVAEHRGRCLGIDLVGYPGAFGDSFELERYRMFNRAGLPLLPIPYFAWIHDRQACLDAITRRLESES